MPIDSAGSFTLTSVVRGVRPATNVTSRRVGRIPTLDGMNATTRVHAPTIALAAAYGALLATIGLWPRHVDASLSLADWSVTRRAADLVTLTPEQVVATAEVSANAVLFVPVGLAVAFWWPRICVWAAVAAALSIAVVIELAQWLAPVDRTPSLIDLAANTAGACVGFVAVRAATAHPRWRVALLGTLIPVVVAVLGVLVWGLLAGS